VSSGEIVMPMDAHIVTASKDWIAKEIDGARRLVHEG
jgi:hypothetical protein